MLGHMDFAPNKEADKEAKWAAQGYSSPSRDLPKYLRKQLLVSVSVLQQQSNTKLQQCWAHQWKALPCYHHLCSIDNFAPLKKFLTLTKISLANNLPHHATPHRLNRSKSMAISYQKIRDSLLPTLPGYYGGNHMTFPPPMSTLCMTESTTPLNKN